MKQFCYSSLVLSVMLSMLLAGCGGDEPTADTSGNQDAAADTASASDSVTPPDQNTGPACNVIKQEGCAEGEKCTYAQNASKPSCVEAGTKAIGEACDGQGDCKDGTCLSLNDTGNLCYKYCGTKVHCDGEKCVELSDSPFKVCELDVEYETCDMLAQGCSNPEHGCYVSDEGAVCLPAGTAQQGEDCDSVGSCAPGNVCINKRCYKVCNVNEEDPCGDFKPCANYYGNAGYCD